MCKNFLSLEDYLEIGFFIHENSNISGIINTNNYQIFVSHINNVGFEQNIPLCKETGWGNITGIVASYKF